MSQTLQEEISLERALTTKIANDLAIKLPNTHILQVTHDDPSYADLEAVVEVNDSELGIQGTFTAVRFTITVEKDLDITWAYTLAVNEEIHGFEEGMPPPDEHLPKALIVLRGIKHAIAAATNGKASIRAEDSSHDFDLDSLLVFGRIPAHTACPYKGACASMCHHKGIEHPVSFSCATARGFDLSHKRM